MKRIIALVLIAAGLIATYLINSGRLQLPTFTQTWESSGITSLNLTDPMQKKPLQKYSFPNLRKTEFTSSELTLGEELDLGTNVPTYQFFFSDNFAPDKQISGTFTVPNTPGEYPVIVLFRGWADEEIYTPGYGTKNAAAYFSRNGYITVAPDFLGYADSDPYADDFAEARFQTYTTALTMLASVPNLNVLFAENDFPYLAQPDNVGIWGHSNGGQISLAALAVTGRAYPTTLWAPVTIPFPDNVLHYAGDQEDGGQLLKDLVADFNDRYDGAIEHTPTNYLEWIDAPILLHQGSADDSVPQEWNDDFAAEMKRLNKDLTYYTYPGVDHNMRPEWGPVIARDVAFFDAELKE